MTIVNKITTQHTERKEVQIMATKRVSCKEWCKKNNVSIESLVVNRGSDNDKYFFIGQESFKKSPFHYALRKNRMSKAVQSDDKKVIEYWLGISFVN